MVRLGVNIDHVATLRQARYPSRGGPGASPEAFGEPDPVRAAHEAEIGGADCITVHLREDRRHIVDRDAETIRAVARVKFNLEMAASDEMLRFAERLRPHMATLVPEGRQEVTTEGGLDVVGQASRLRDVVARLRGAGIVASAFIDADLRQVEAAHTCAFDCCEIHTGPYAHAFATSGGEFRDTRLATEVEQLALASGEVRAAGMRFNAGHGLNYANVLGVSTLPGVSELHIGHAIVSRAVYTGLRRAVADMKALISRPAD